MAPRGRSKGFKMPDCYVYAVMDRDAVVYVGKGTGRRYKESARRHGGEGKILERFDCEDKAFARERELINEWQPALNVSTGGTGGRVKPKPISSEMKRALREQEREQREMREVGLRRYIARWLLGKDLGAVLPASEVAGIRQRLEPVANGPWA